MKTTHLLLNSDSRDLNQIDNHSIDLIVTSPPYPMIKMWDELFGQLNPAITPLIESAANNGMAAFELMHLEMNKIWDEVNRVLKPGGIACINIGDATRKFKYFQLFSNHNKVINHFLKLGMHQLPMIHWFKPSNSPTKFMGSGTLPVAAYNTLEHEYILVFRKPPTRIFKTDAQKLNRQNSSIFWYERNKYFCDNWTLKGVSQKLKNKKLGRERNASYPLELANRLIKMYSVKGDTVLDPFLGLGTTSKAAIMLERNSVGVDIDNSFIEVCVEILADSKKDINKLIDTRLSDYQTWITKRAETHTIKYVSKTIGLPVISKQELNIEIKHIDDITTNNKTITVTYK